MAEWESIVDKRKTRIPDSHAGGNAAWPSIASARYTDNGQQQSFIGHFDHERLVDIQTSTHAARPANLTDVSKCVRFAKPDAPLRTHKGRRPHE